MANGDPPAAPRARSPTEQELFDERERQQAQLASIVESSDDAILSKTLDGIIRSWNGGATRLFGYTAEEAIGQPITLLIPPDRLNEETAILQRLRRGERVEHFETVRRTKEGRLLDISVTISPLRDSSGRLIGASKIGRDITARKQAEAALRESEARHRFLSALSAITQPLTDAAEVMKVTARLLAEHLDVERCAYAEVEDGAVFVITGDHTRGVPSIVGRWPVSAFGEGCVRSMRANAPFVVNDVDSDERVTEEDRLAYRATTIQAVVCVPLHKAGQLAAAIAVHQTRPRAWTQADIDLVATVGGLSWESLERMRVARGLRETADRLALAIDAARLGDWSWDAATDVITMSPRGRAIFGIEGWPTCTWTELQELLHPDDRAHAREGVTHAVETGGQYDVEYRVMRPDGVEEWVSAKGRAQYLMDGTPSGMFGVVQDITESKRFEHALQSRALELAEADRKKDDFIALLAHELRNPLAPLRTGLEILRHGKGSVVDRARETMARQLSHMVRLIDDLLDVSRIGRNKLHLQRARVSLQDVVAHAVEAASPAVEAARHTLRVDLPTEPIWLDADLTRLAQVFGNLLTNAAKYTRPEGRIAIEGRVTTDEAIVDVIDNGIGIPSESLPRVFDMFAQLDRSFERAGGGLGIGLALVKGLVEAHGGSVQAQSAGAGAGSTFTVRLPRSPKREESAEPLATSTVARALARRKVLVVDDNLDGAQAMASLLELIGHDVHVAHDGMEAIAAAERLRPDLVLMDVGLPKLNGLEATRQIRKEPWGRAVRIFALTGFGQDADREASRSAGCDGHLVKPVAMPDLERTLAQVGPGSLSRAPASTRG